MIVMYYRIAVALLALVLLTMNLSVAHAQQAAEKTSAEVTEFAKLQAKLASTRLALAEMELQQAQEQNRRSAGIVPLVVIESLELSLAKAKAQVAAAAGDKDALQKAWVASAEASVKVARNRLQRMKEFSERTGEAQGDVKRAEFRLQIAELERDCMAGLFELPLEEQLKWQVDRLNAMIDGLSDRVIVLEDKR
jgi:hypothetical protein